MPFDLHKNPFNLLRASPVDSLDVLQEKHDDAILDGDHDETSLADALRRLTSPKTRLEAELSWLLDQSGSGARELLSLLRKLPKGVGGRNDWDSKLSGLSALSKANVLADLASHHGVGIGSLSLLSEAWDQISVGTVDTFITDLRRHSGQTRPDRDLLSSALDDLRRAHVSAAHSGMTRSGNEQSLMTSLAENAVKRNECGKFLNQLAERYDTASEPALAAIAARLEILDQETRATPDDAEALALRIRSLLADWDEINQPIQLLEQLRGHEEGRSRKLAQDLRNLALWLANDEGRHEAALTITEALLETFPELDQTAAQLVEDAKTLRRLVQEGARLKPLRELERLCKAVKRDPAEFMRVVREEGFETRSSSQAGSTAKAFQGAVANTRGLEIEQAPWGMLLDLARQLIREWNAGDVGHMILSFMLSPTCAPTTTVTKVLKSDLREASAKAKRFRQSVTPRHASRPRATPTAADVNRSASTDSHTLSRREAYWPYYLFWFIICLIILIYAATTTTSPAPRNALTDPTVTQPSTGAPAKSAPAPQVVRPAEPVKKLPTESLAETIPPGGTLQTLTADQLRWCVFESVRVDAARPLVNERDQGEINRFNAKVDFLNSRCGSYRYNESHKWLVDGQRSAQIARLSEQGRAWALAGRLAPQKQLPSPLAAPSPETPPSPKMLQRARTCAQQALRVDFLGDLKLSIAERTWRIGVRNAYLRDCIIDPIPLELRAAAKRVAESERDELQTDALNQLSLRRSYAGLDLRNAAAARRVQSKLRELGLYSGPIDGVFGRGSTTALRAFKRSRPDLANDGFWDAETAAALFSQ
jgi:hypothetical protein